ncbi:hypothetical protein ACFYXP_38080 [Streptomyces sp. NPDC002466]|uniref:hypothetical protein n=1 Tax=Streptomyces sp. NPDC002466 TaxID=3364646 RepID=UPI00369FAC71
MLDDLLVVGFGLETRREVHIGARPVEQWRARGYGRGETVVCLYCYRGVDAPAGTRVPLLARGLIGGLGYPAPRPRRAVRKSSWSAARSTASSWTSPAGARTSGPAGRC